MRGGEGAPVEDACQRQEAKGGRLTKVRPITSPLDIRPQTYVTVAVGVG